MPLYKKFSDHKNNHLVIWNIKERKQELISALKQDSSYNLKLSSIKSQACASAAMWASCSIMACLACAAECIWGSRACARASKSGTCAARRSATVCTHTPLADARAMLLPGFPKREPSPERLARFDQSDTI